MSGTDRCKEDVVDPGGMGFHSHQCTRKAIKDGYCKQHHPDTKAERDAKNHAAWEEKRKKQPWYVIEELKKELEAAKAEVGRLKKWQREMVEKAAAKSLDGYRELGAKCAALEKERDEFKVRIEGMYQVLLLFAREKEELTAKVGELQSARERDGSEAFPDERTLTREQVQESLRDAGIDMEKAQAKLKAVLKERKE